MSPGPRWLLTALAAGAVWWLVGFVPWLLHGEGTPAPVQPSLMTSLAVMACLGGVGAGVLAGLGGGRAAVRVSAVVAGVALAAAVVLPVAAARFTSQAWEAASLVALALQLVAVVAAAVGVAAGVVLAVGPGWLRPVAAAVPVALLPGWVVDLLGGGPTQIIGWAFAAALGVGLGLATRRWPYVAGWLVALPLAWAVQSAIPATASVSGLLQPGRLSSRDPFALLPVWSDTFVAAFGTPAAHRPVTWVCGVVLALLVLTVRLGVRRAPRLSADGS